MAHTSGLAASCSSCSRSSQNVAALEGCTPIAALRHSCAWARSTARRLVSRSVPTVRMRTTPAADARSRTCSRSPEKAGSSRCACESTSCSLVSSLDWPSGPSAKLSHGHVRRAFSTAQDLGLRKGQPEAVNLCPRTVEHPAHDVHRLAARHPIVGQSEQRGGDCARVWRPRLPLDCRAYHNCPFAPRLVFADSVNQTAKVCADDLLMQLR